MSTVRFPAMRLEVVRALEALSDVAHQRCVWIDRKLPAANYYDCLDLCINILYDDCQVLPNPGSRIGTILLDTDEVDRLLALDRVLGPMISRLGNAADIEYVS